MRALIQCFLFIMAMLLVCYSGSAIPCSCIGPVSVMDGVTESDAVIVGQVLSAKFIEVKADSLIPGQTVRQMCYKVVVLKGYKGKEAGDTVSIITGEGDADCGYRFSTGQKYIVYCYFATRRFKRGEAIDDFLSTSICTRTQLKNNDEIEEIEKVLKDK